MTKEVRIATFENEMVAYAVIAVLATARNVVKRTARSIEFADGRRLCIEPKGSMVNPGKGFDLVMISEVQK